MNFGLAAGFALGHTVARRGGFAVGMTFVMLL